MATVNQNEEENNGQGPQPISGTGGASASGRGVAGQAAAPVSQVQQNAGAQNQQGYTDVASYLNANQQGSNQLGSQAASNLTNTYNKTQGDIAKSSQNFQGAVNQGYVPENTQLIQQAASDPNAFAYNQPAPSQSTGFLHSNSQVNQAPTLNQSNIDAFQGQLNDSYTGPTNWGDYGTLQGQVAQANQQAGLINTAGGRNVLAQQLEQPGASAGVNNFDALLLGAPGATGQVQAAAAPFANLNSFLDSQNTANLGAVTNAQNAAQKTSQDALNAFTGANGTLTGLNNTINQNTSTALSQAQAQQAQVKADIAKIYGGQAVNTAPTTITGYNKSQNPWVNTQNYNVNSGALSPQDLQSLGMTQDQWNQLSGALSQAGTSQYFNGHNFGAGSGTSQIDLNQFLNQQDPTAAINAGTVATPEQYQQMAAIQALLGGKTPQGSAINPALASLAGTYNPNSLNQFNYQAALQQAQGTAQDERTAAQQEANNLSSSADAAHNAAKKGGGLLGKVKQAAAVINPTTYLTNSALLDEAKKAAGK